MEKDDKTPAATVQEQLGTALEVIAKKDERIAELEAKDIEQQRHASGLAGKISYLTNELRRRGGEPVDYHVKVALADAVAGVPDVVVEPLFTQIVAARLTDLEAEDQATPRRKGTGKERRARLQNKTKGIVAQAAGAVRDCKAQLRNEIRQLEGQRNG